jgi:hypothetical protein
VHRDPSQGPLPTGRFLRSGLTLGARNTGPDQRSCWPSLDRAALLRRSQRREARRQTPDDAAVCACIACTPTLNNIALRSATDARDACFGVTSRKRALLHHPETRPREGSSRSQQPAPRIPVAIWREASGETLLTDEDILHGFLDFS